MRRSFVYCNEVCTFNLPGAQSLSHRRVFLLLYFAALRRAGELLPINRKAAVPMVPTCRTIFSISETGAMCRITSLLLRSGSRQSDALTDGASSPERVRVLGGTEALIPLARDAVESNSQEPALSVSSGLPARAVASLARCISPDRSRIWARGHCRPHSPVSLGRRADVVVSRAGPVQNENSEAAGKEMRSLPGSRLPLFAKAWTSECARPERLAFSWTCAGARA